MRKFLVTGLTAILAAFVVAAGAPASAETAEAQGNVTVFSTEFSELTVWENPSGCHQLPFDAHIMVNQTDMPMMIHGDPLCATQGLSVRPGYGSHVPSGTGSFSVDA
jgi:hypothetical protein